MARKHYGRELWERMIGFVEQDDGLPVYECGPWTIEKLKFLAHYLSLVTSATGLRASFSSINFIDLFCGSGVDFVPELKSVQRFPGSTLIAAGCEQPFTNIYANDENGEKINALKSRIERLQSSSTISYFTLDANEAASQIVRELPNRSLSVAFIDPQSLRIEFETIRTLSQAGCMDLLILFADRMDLGRNIDAYYASGSSDKLDKFFGFDFDWRAEYEQLANREPDRVREFFTNLYIQRLGTLGYLHTGMKEN